MSIPYKDVPDSRRTRSRHTSVIVSTIAARQKQPFPSSAFARPLRPLGLPTGCVGATRGIYPEPPETPRERSWHPRSSTSLTPPKGLLGSRPKLRDQGSRTIEQGTAVWYPSRRWQSWSSYMLEGSNVSDFGIPKH